MAKKVSSEQSPSMTLNSVDYKKIAKGAAIAFGGAALMSIATAMQGGPIVSWPAVIGAALSVGINAVLKFLQGQE